MKQVETIITQTNATMEMEGMPLTNTDKERIRKCIGDNDKVKLELEKLIKKHKVGMAHEL